ncbi:uncharacterized protein [Haliotis cracherodii]|uniref:uncharacterized protein n=1 Tax=Haliotis cracherodii TaxID=6455 RepID=UPI0039E748A1
MATQQFTGSRSKPKRRHVDTATSSDEESVHNIDSWPRFLVVGGVDGESIKINPFVVSKSIEGICGTVKNVTRLRSGSLLVECARRQQSQNLLNAHHFANTEIVVSVHKTLNSCRGIVRDRAKCLSDMSEEEIATEMQQQGVSSVKRFTRREGDTIIKTNTYLFTFALPKIPSSVKAGYFNIGVDVYIPSPLRCFNCQHFGHGAKSCHATHICSRCSKHHDGTDCTDNIRCANCGGDHMSSFKSCPAFIKQIFFLKLKYSNGISFADAKKLVDQESNPSSSTLTYSAAVSFSPLKVDNGCQTAINWISDEQTNLYEVHADKSPTSSAASQTELFNDPLPDSIPDSIPKPETRCKSVPDMKPNVSSTRKEKKQQKKKESKALKHIEVPSPLTVPLEVHNPFEPLAMEVTPPLPLQQRGPSPRSRSPVEPP